LAQLANLQTHFNPILTTFAGEYPLGRTPMWTNPATDFTDDPIATDGSSNLEITGMKIGMDKSLRTAAAVAVWMTLLALSQEAAATGDGVRTDTPVALSRSS
jgi:hypothetical protein